MKTIVMTGATSFLGRNLVKTFIKKGYEVFALVRKNSASIHLLPEENERFHLMYGSLENLTCIEDYIKEANYFVHFAWDGSGNAGRANYEIQSKNVWYSMEALKIADRLGCESFWFPGSQAEYGVKHEPISEEMECHPVSEYGKSKLKFGNMAEEFCRDKKIRYIHLRIFSIYGADDRPGTLVDTCVRKFNSGETVQLGNCTQKWNYLYIDDFTDMISRMMEKNIDTGIYNISGVDTRVLREFVTEIYHLSNQTGNYEFGNNIVNPEGTPDLEPVIKKVDSVIGTHKITTFSDGIREIMKRIEEESFV